jgi:hypothetical protein
MRYLPFKCLLLLALSIASVSLSACSCLPDAFNQATFEKFAFIAHVKITSSKEINGPPTSPGYWEAERIMHFEVIELLRGELTLEAIELDHESSCGTFIEPEEEWIFFAFQNKSGTLVIAPCTPTTVYRNADEQRVDYYGRPTRTKAWLNDYCEVSIPGVTPSGPSAFTSYYSNGQLEERIEYLDGNKNGKAVWYFKDGNLLDERYYSKGRRTGLRRHYFKAGELDFEQEFNWRGELVRELNMKGKYQDYSCETLFNVDSGVDTEICYRENGKPLHLRKEIDYHPIERKDFNEKGNLIHHIVYGENWEHKILLDSTKIN